MTQAATVLFNIGATKAGTTWLYRYLSAHPDCHLRSVKELHYFDAVDQDDYDWQIERFTKMRNAGSSASGSADYQALIDLLGQKGEDADGYLAYLNGGRDGQELVADTTPAYALLSGERFAKMAAIAPDVRFIYILRDPVSRFWSHVRMKAGRRDLEKASVQKWSNRIFWRVARGQKFQGILERGDYRAVLEKLRQAVDPSRLLVLFYEDLFNNKTVARICEFLGISMCRADFSARYNDGPKANMSAKQFVLAQGWLADQYDYVRTHFGPVPDAWQANMVRAKA